MSPIVYIDAIPDGFFKLKCELCKESGGACVQVNVWSFRQFRKSECICLWRVDERMLFFMCAFFHHSLCPCVSCGVVRRQAMSPFLSSDLCTGWLRHFCLFWRPPPPPLQFLFGSSFHSFKLSWQPSGLDPPSRPIPQIECMMLNLVVLQLFQYAR